MAERRVWIRMADGVRLAATLYLPEQGPSRCTWWR
jgi:predicted acyl esterase